MKKVIFSLTAIVATLSASAQQVAESKSFMSDPFTHPMLPVYAISALFFVVVVLVAVVALYMIRILNVLTEKAAQENAARQGVVYVPRPTWWSRFVQQMNASVPLEQEKNIELDHNYDGIKELDNHLPPWWKWLFYGTIGWSFVYIVVFHVSDSLPLSDDEYAQEVALAEAEVKKIQALKPRVEIDENTLAFTNDAQLISHGKQVFTDNNCGSCHGAEGGGNAIGPNLVDEYWIHGGEIKNIFSTVRNGVVEKGMPAWGKAMSPQDVRDVTFFIMSLQGTKPANAKAPQGNLFKPATIAKDSTQASL
jgi:cytochrome c oxidase cbb3-type subunit III